MPFTMLSSYIPILLLALNFVQALPQPHRFARADDSESLYQREFESTELFRRSPVASPCSTLDLDDAETLPGWNKLLQYARSTWGEGDWTISINPPGYKDKIASLCVHPVQVVQTGESTCQENRVDIEPTNKDGTQIKVDQGYTNTGIWNITNTTHAGHAEFFLGKFHLPNIPNLNFNPLHTTGKFINAPYNSFSTVATNVTYKNNELTQVDGKTCIGTVLQQQCSTPAKGRIQLIASGYVWFNYKTKRAPLANPKGGKHRKYAVKMEDVLKNATERSTWIDFNGVMNTTWRYDYFDECRWNFKLE